MNELAARISASKQDLPLERWRLACLLGLTAENRSRSFARFYATSVGSVTGIACQFVQSAQQVQEVMNDVFLHAWQHADSYRPERGSLDAWLIGVTRHKAIDSYRRRQRLRAHEDDTIDASDVVDLAREDVRDELEHVAMREALLLASKRLPKARRRLLRLSFLSGLTHEQIADKMHLPLGSVKSHIRRGLADLRNALNCPEQPVRPLRTRLSPSSQRRKIYGMTGASSLAQDCN